MVSGKDRHCRTRRCIWHTNATESQRINITFRILTPSSSHFAHQPPAGNIVLLQGITSQADLLFPYYSALASCCHHFRLLPASLNLLPLLLLLTNVNRHLHYAVASSCHLWSAMERRLQKRVQSREEVCTVALSMTMTQEDEH